MKNLVKIISIVTLLGSNAFAGGNSTFNLDNAIQEVQDLSYVEGLSRTDIRANRKKIRATLYETLSCSRDQGCTIVSKKKTVLPGSQELENFFNDGWGVIEDLDNTADHL